MDPTTCEARDNPSAAVGGHVVTRSDRGPLTIAPAAHMCTDSLSSIRDLDRREWRKAHTPGAEPARRPVVVSVLDIREGSLFRALAGADERPLDLFPHPFAYAAHDRADTGSVRVL